MWVRPAIPPTIFNPQLCLLAGLMLSCSAANGQLAEPSGPAFPGIAPPVVCPEEPVYWIASSRNCCQRHQTRCPKGSLDYFAADDQNRLAPLQEEAFFSSLRYDVPICFVIHGDLTSFEDVHRAAPSIVKWIKHGAPGQPVQIVFYTWPSDDEFQPIPQLNINARGERAEFNGCYLAKLIGRFPAQTRISFFGHSFGTRVTAAALHLLAGGVLPGCDFRCEPGAVRSYRAVYAAAAMDRDWMNPGNRYGLALTITESLLNLRNGADLVINLYPMRTLFGRQALGRVGFSPRDRLWMGPLSARVIEWDVTLAVGSHHAWSYYYSRPEIAGRIAPLLVYSLGPQQVITAKPVQPAPNIQTTTTPPRPRILRDSTRTQETSSIRSGL